MPRPQLIEILKCLPRTNCRECGQPTCMVFATLVMEGAKVSDDCPLMASDQKALLDAYMSRFTLA
jgi:CO dehydrogenase/acetyl-CoA synthase gamma subunit (corrinoid Fe-S protein)